MKEKVMIKNGIEFYYEEKANNTFTIKGCRFLGTEKHVILPDNFDLGKGEETCTIEIYNLTLDPAIQYTLEFPDTKNNTYILINLTYPRSVIGNLELGAGESIIEIKPQATKFLSIETLKIGKNIKEISKASGISFSWCSELKTVNLEESGLEKISKFMFCHCGELKNIKLPQELKNIDKFAFYHCYKLEKIEFPENLCTLGIEAFLNTGLKEVIFNGPRPRMFVNTFEYVTRSLKVFVPEKYLKIYEKSSVLSKFKKLPLEIHVRNFGIKWISKKKVEIVQKLDEDGNENLYKGVVKISKQLVGEDGLVKKVKTINPMAFLGCNGLEKLIIPRDLKQDNLLVDDTVEIEYYD